MQKQYLKGRSVSKNVESKLLSSKRGLEQSYHQVRTLPGYYVRQIRRRKVIDLMNKIDSIVEEIDNLIYNGE